MGNASMPIPQFRTWCMSGTRDEQELSTAPARSYHGGMDSHSDWIHCLVPTCLAYLQSSMNLCLEVAWPRILSALPWLTASAKASVKSKTLRPTENPGAEEHDRLGKCRQDISIDCRRPVMWWVKLSHTNRGYPRTNRSICLN